ncbi:MAG: amidase family protein [Natrialbaceae archaeon]|nr:amidase family protein [Natrialbaceae archaeon]
MSVPVDIDFVSALEREPSSLRIAFSPDLDVFDVNESVATVLEEAVGDLADAGATVDRVDIDHGYTMGELQMAVTATYTTSLREVATTVEAEFGIDLLTDESTSESLRTMLSMAEHIGANDIAESGMIRTGFFDAIQDRLDEYDLIITPTTARVDIGLEEDISTTGFDFPLTWPFNLTGHPAASVPAGLTEEGHPVGCQIIGQRYEDDTVFAGMAALERVRPWTHL